MGQSVSQNQKIQVLDLYHLILNLNLKESRLICAQALEYAI